MKTSANKLRSFSGEIDAMIDETLAGLRRDYGANFDEINTILRNLKTKAFTIYNVLPRCPLIATQSRMLDRHSAIATRSLRSVPSYREFLDRTVRCHRPHALQ
jgi:hypothetical protein